MEKYPLAPLLKVREYREDAAKNALSAAERAVVEAQEAVERCRGELERYKVWRQEEVERRYDAIMGKGLSLKELDVFKAGLGALECPPGPGPDLPGPGLGCRTGRGSAGAERRRRRRQ